MADATAWIDRHVERLGAETVDLAEAAGRVLAQDVAATAAFPPFDRAALDGVALRADETAGASAYNPLSFRIAAAGRAALPANDALPVSAGDRLPAGADAVVAIEHVQRGPSGTCEVIDPVAVGSGIEPSGSHFAQDARLLEAGRRLRPRDIGLLASAGLSAVPVTRRPRVDCFLVTPPPSGDSLPDANGPLLRASLARDGGMLGELRRIARGRAAIAQVLTAAQADIVIIAGGTGPGANDHAAAALAEAGELAIHRVALHPGESAGIGRAARGAAVFLVPGTPVACLWAYEFLAGRAIRRLAGRDPALPFRRREMRAARKIVSAIGMTEICPVRRLSDERVEPIASAAGLAAIAAADGFVILAEGSEGVPEGAPVLMYLHGEGDRPLAYRDTDQKP